MPGADDRSCDSPLSAEWRSEAGTCANEPQKSAAVVGALLLGHQRGHQRAD